MFSPAAAAFDDHTVVVLEHSFGVLVEIEHGDGRQRGGHAARPRNGGRIDGADECLDDRMVGGVEMIAHLGGTLAGAVVRVVVAGRHYPVVPADIFEADLQRVAAALVALAPAGPGAALPPLQRHQVGAVLAAAAVPLVLGVEQQQWLLGVPPGVGWLDAGGWLEGTS